MIAALFVAKDGAYYGIPDVDPWDAERDAREYRGPYPVVAHPPCARWSRLAVWSESRGHGEVGDDGGCFESALLSVNRYGGVLEHPAHSKAWSAHHLPWPMRGAWSYCLMHPGLVIEVDQGHYGHRSQKPTWLYALAPPHLLPRMPIAPAPLGVEVENLSRRERSATPEPFRDLLIGIARSVPDLAAAQGGNP